MNGKFGDRYIMKCICIDEGNDFGVKLDEVFYYNHRAQSVRYKTRMTNNHYDWNTHTQYGNENPYCHSFFDTNLPITPNINNAQLYKKLAELEKIKRLIERIGDFRCEIYKVKTSFEKIS